MSCKLLMAHMPSGEGAGNDEVQPSEQLLVVVTASQGHVVFRQERTHLHSCWR